MKFIILNTAELHIGSKSRNFVLLLQIDSNKCFLIVRVNMSCPKQKILSSLGHHAKFLKMYIEKVYALKF